VKRFHIIAIALLIFSIFLAGCEQPTSWKTKYVTRTETVTTTEHVLIKKTVIPPPITIKRIETTTMTVPHTYTSYLQTRTLTTTATITETPTLTTNIIIPSNINEEDTWGLVTNVVDGDTIDVEIGTDQKIFKVRYIGIDAPEEGRPYYEEAKNKNIELVLGKFVRLERDVSETDQYGRLLRYVYVSNTFINAEMVRTGYAQVATFPPDVEKEEFFIELQEEAISNSRGLWAENNSAKQGIYVGSVMSDIYHKPNCYWAQQINVKNEIWFNSKIEAERAGYRPCRVCKP